MSVFYQQAIPAHFPTISALVRSGTWLANGMACFYCHPGRRARCKGHFSDLTDFFSNLDYIKSSQRFALLSGSRAVCNINYEAAYYYHLEKKADITVLYKAVY